MYPREHIIYGVIAATVPAIASGFTEAGLFLAATTLIDHYLRYLFVARKMARLKTAHTYYMAFDAAAKKLGPGAIIPKGMYPSHCRGPRAAGGNLSGLPSIVVGVCRRDVSHAS